MKLVKKSGQTTIQIFVDEWRKIGIEQGWIKTAQTGGGWELIRRELDGLIPGVEGALGGRRVTGDQIKLLGGEAFVLNAITGHLGIQSPNGHEVAMRLFDMLGNNTDAYARLDQLIEPLGREVANLADQIREGRILAGQDETIKDGLKKQYDDIISFITNAGRRLPAQNTLALPQEPQNLQDTTKYRII